MELINVLLIAIALSLDASGVALGLGCGRRLTVKDRSAIIFSFGFFQGLLTFLGAILGSYVNNNIFNISGYVSGAIILFIGFLFLKEGFESKEECDLRPLNLWAYIVLGISVSIDALGVGFSVLYQYKLSAIIMNSLLIGLVASTLTLTSLVIVKYIRDFFLVEKYADYIGGVILVLLGLKTFFGL